MASTYEHEVSVTVDGVMYSATAGPPIEVEWGPIRMVTIRRGAEGFGGAVMYPIRIMGGGDGWSVGDQDSDELTDDVLDALGVAFTDVLGGTWLSGEAQGTTEDGDEWRVHLTGPRAPDADVDAEPKAYTYTIFDGHPAVSGDSKIPGYEGIAIESASYKSAIEEARDAMSILAAGLSTDDGYEVGDRLHALVWDADGTVVGTPRYTLTAEDLGVEDDGEDDGEDEVAS